MSRTDTTFSFADLVRHYKIEVPIIQRDYAQGRDTLKAESIRKHFVADLLTSLKTEHQKQLELSFVYGRVDNGVFVPVDGQQRLTTLYLLHLYLVKRCKMTHCVSCIYEDVLSRFTYATRQSAREFCEIITDPKIKLIPESGGLIEYVFDQPWFFVEWKIDPTIEGMLKVLEEIHSQVESLTPCCCGTILTKLFDANAPIRFRFMDMEEYGQMDDLYLKMNARGLPLTALDNLKCSIERYCEKHFYSSNNAALEYITECGIKEEEWGKMTTGKKLSRLFDGVWLDAFWKLDAKNTTAQCDATMMVFVARLFALFALDNDIFPQKDEKGDECEYWNRVDDDLIGVTGQENYLPFDWFKSVLEHNRKNPDARVAMLNRFAYWMNSFSRLDKTSSARWLVPSWENPTTWKDFLEKFKMAKEWKRYAALYAIISFFDYWEAEWDEAAFKEWMRVQWNVIENASIDSIEAMQRYVKACAQLANEAKNMPILAYLQTCQFQCGSFEDQYNEEMTKANLILDKGRKDDVLAAEQLPWFRGRISAIIENGDIDTDLESWFSKDTVGIVETKEGGGHLKRVAWVEQIIVFMEQQYNAPTDPKPLISLPVKNIIQKDTSLKDVIYDKNHGRWIINARKLTDFETVRQASVWRKRMNGNDGDNGWQDRVCIRSYKDGVYAYRVSYITGAYRLDCKINWWYEFIKEENAKKTSWQTRDYGTWVQCEIESGKYKGIYALCQDGPSAFIQRQTSNGEWYPSNEEAKQLWENANGNWSSLLDELMETQL